METALPTASWARRILALIVDWFASTLVVILVLGGVDKWAGDQRAGFYVLAVFVLESAAFTALSGGSIITKKITPISTAEYPTPARRPAYSVLSNHRLSQTYRLQLPEWRDQLKTAIASV